MDRKLTTVLLTGLSGAGKTTLVKKVVDRLRRTSGITCHGFFTEEVSSGDDIGHCLGFDVITLKGARGILARERIDINNVDCPSVGNYRVFVKEFERVALTPLVTCPRLADELLVIDELGKMEFQSSKFATAVKSLLGQVPMLATVPEKTDESILEELRCLANTKIYDVTPANRDALPDQVIEAIKAILCA